MPLSYSILNHRKLENKLKYKFENRRYVIGGAVIALVIIFIVRLFYLQIIDSDYKAWADSNAFLKKTIYPSRGILYDRNEKLLVYNQPSYDVMMIMREVQPFDTLDFCRILGITKEQYLKRIADMKNRRLNPGYSSYTPQIFMSQLSAEECGILQEKLYKFPGFYVQNRTIREYTYPNAALLLGNVGEVNTRDIEADSYYVPGDNSGRTGIEGSYEKVLRGEKGVEILLRDAHGRIKGHYEDGKYDVPAVSGKNLKLSIDIDLQAYGEKELSSLSCREMVTFHDGFGYFAHAFDLTIAAAMEEESGSEASAKELIHLIELMQERSIPAVFTEVNGSTSAANIICAELSVSAYALDMGMGGDYFEIMYHNIQAVKEALG